MNFSELVDSLTGYEDLVVEGWFGRSLGEMNGWTQRRAARFRGASTTSP